ncbi:hypothetical protein FHP25_00270 [Vineibacter terrae]|uniref:Uncharacterized protein n=1 Tax=Vineibacter terrae TaxID=2586908 RepID=A0A5C8PUZ7_9HYPH|nr:hypothetical protein [Vineibacter terrae]TXL82172.1 hypothetical protein FHP25_00270 [Vineibacter terrae]
MIRVGLALAALAVCAAPALAQPAPRVVTDLALPVAEGYTFDPIPSPGRLAVGRDGGFYVLLHMFKRVADAADSAREEQVDLLAVAPAGTVTRRRTLPVQEVVGSSRFDLNALGVVAARSGDLAVFMSTTDPAGRSSARLLRLDPDFNLKKAAPVGPPTRHDDPGSFYVVETYLPTPDNAVLLAGGWGLGPVAWWMGKLSLDGVRLWQAGPGAGFPERVATIAPRPDGTWLSVAVEMHGVGRGTGWYIRRHATDGRPLARLTLAQPDDAVVAVLREGCMLIVNANPDSRRKAEMVLVDDRGRVARRMPWPYPRTSSVTANGAGIAAVVSDSDATDAPTWLVRADAKGTIIWRQGPMSVDEMTSLPDGRIAALAHPGQADAPPHLVVYADP